MRVAGIEIRSLQERTCPARSSQKNAKEQTRRDAIPPERVHSLQADIHALATEVLKQETRSGHARTGPPGDVRAGPMLHDALLM
jgi:hypothetical protein